MMILYSSSQPLSGVARRCSAADLSVSVSSPTFLLCRPRVLTTGGSPQLSRTAPFSFVEIREQTRLIGKVSSPYVWKSRRERALCWGDNDPPDIDQHTSPRKENSTNTRFRRTHVTCFDPLSRCGTIPGFTACSRFGLRCQSLRQRRARTF